MKSKTFIFLIILTLYSCSQSADETKFSNLLKKVELSDLNGSPIDLSDYKGKTVFLNFWATWCKPCIREMPSIESALNILENEDDEFVFLAASDEELEKIKKFAKKRPFKFKYVKLNIAFEYLDILVVPTTYIINPKGKLIIVEEGAKDWAHLDQINLLKEISLKL